MKYIHNLYVIYDTRYEKTNNDNKKKEYTYIYT